MHFLQDQIIGQLHASVCDQHSHIGIAKPCARLTCYSIDLVPLQLKEKLLLAQGKFLQLEGLVGSQQLGSRSNIGIKGQVPSYLQNTKHEQCLVEMGIYTIVSIVYISSSKRAKHNIKPGI